MAVEVAVVAEVVVVAAVEVVVAEAGCKNHLYRTIDTRVEND